MIYNMNYIKKFNESLDESSITEITQYQAYTFSEVDFPKSTIDEIESMESYSVELIIRDDEMFLYEEETHTKERKIVKVKVINLIELSGGLRGNTKWTISTFYTKEGFYICMVDKHKWRGSWRMVYDKRVYYKCTLDGLLDLISDSENWF